MSGSRDRDVVWAHLVTVMGAFAAEVITAHLGAEGIIHQVRGSTDGPYRLTIGPMSQVEILVPLQELDTARALVAADPRMADLADPPEETRLPPRPRAHEADDADDDVYARSERPDRRLSGPRQLRRRRAIS